MYRMMTMEPRPPTEGHALVLRTMPKASGIFTFSAVRFLSFRWGFIKMCIGTLGAIGAIATTGGGLFQGIANSQAANYRATVARNNATIANQNATRAIAAGQQQAANQSRQNAAAFGALKTGLAANNIDTNSGSAVDLEASQRTKGQLDDSNTLYNAQV